MKQAATTAKKPFSAFIEWTSSEDIAAAAVFTELLSLVCIWTMPTPMARNKSASHWLGLSFLRKRRTEKAAVVRIFI